MGVEVRVAGPVVVLVAQSKVETNISAIRIQYRYMRPILMAHGRRLYYLLVAGRVARLEFHVVYLNHVVASLLP